MQQIADSCNAGVALLQETHLLVSKSLYLAGFYLATHQPSATHGIAIFVRHSSPATITSESTPSSVYVSQWHTIETSGISITNVYCPPPAPFSVHTLPLPPACYTVFVAVDFNCHHTSWGYSAGEENGEALLTWAESSDLQLLYDPREPRWNTTTNPDLAFARVRVGQPLNLRNAIEPFPHTTHRPSVIAPHNLFYSLPSKPVLCWNFGKANWNLFSKSTKEGIAHLPPLQNRDVSAVYNAFCRMLLNTAKRVVPRWRRSHYAPYWDDHWPMLHLLEKNQIIRKLQYLINPQLQIPCVSTWM